MKMRKCAISCFLKICLTAREQSLFDPGLLCPDAFACSLKSLWLFILGNSLATKCQKAGLTDLNVCEKALKPGTNLLLTHNNLCYSGFLHI